MGAREWVLLGVIIVVPLLIAGAVTLWSLKQVRYEKKKVGTVRTSSGKSRRATGTAEGGEPGSTPRADGSAEGTGRAGGEASAGERSAG